MLLRPPQRSLSDRTLRAPPIVRAAFTQAALAAADDLEGDLSDRIRAAVPSSSLEQIVVTSRLDWLSAEVDMDVTEAITRVLGPTRSADFWRRSLLDVMETPLLRPLVEGAIAIFGLAPGNLLKWAPRIWEAIYRNCGTMTVSPLGATTAHIAYESIAPALRRSPDFVEAVRASFETVFTLAHTRGEVVIETMDLAHARALYGVSWTAPSELDALPHP
jgi:hypothetical protein